MKRTNMIKEIIILLMLLLPIIFMLTVWDKLPEKLPTHWNIRGEVDSYGAKYLFALINAAIYLIFLIIPKIDPRKKNYTIFSTSYYKLRLIFTTFFSLLFIMILYNALYSNVDFEKIFPVAFLFLFAALGNYFGTIRSNYFVGIRTPWTLNNEEVWKKTHLFAGKLFAASGIIGGIICMSLDNPAADYFAIGLITVMVILPVVYSYVYYQKVENKTEEI